MKALLANLKHAAQQNDNTIIGGGVFTPGELKRAVAQIEAMPRDILHLEQLVWVVVAKNINGHPRGFEKVAGERFYLLEDEAHAALRQLGEHLDGVFTVAEARIGYAKDPS
jgi:hypothetical protein